MLSHLWHRDFAGFYDRFFATKVFSYLGQIKSGSPLIGVVDYRCYPFFGSRHQFRVIRPAKILSKSALLAFLVGHRIDIVSVEREDDPRMAGRYRGAGGWAQEDRQLLTKIFDGVNFDVYRVVNDAVVPGTNSGK